MNIAILFKSVVILITLILTSLGIITWYFTKKYHLPFPIVIGIASTFVPFLELFLTREVFIGKRGISGKIGNTRRDGGNNGGDLKPFVIFTNLLLLLLETSLLTISTQYLTSSSSNSCTLENSWKSLYMKKDSLTLSSIQDSLKCCGFNSLVDRPYPFPSKKNDVFVDTCQKLYKYTRSCHGVWDGELRVVAGIGVGVFGVVIFVKLILALLALTNPQILHQLYNSKSFSNGYEEVDRNRIEDVGSDDDAEIISQTAIANVDGSGRDADSSSRLLLPQENNTGVNSGVNGARRNQVDYGSSGYDGVW